MNRVKSLSTIAHLHIIIARAVKNTASSTNSATCRRLAASTYPHTKSSPDKSERWLRYPLRSSSTSKRPTPSSQSTQTFRNMVRPIGGGVLRPPPPPQEDRRVEETSRDGFTLPYVGIRRMYTGDFSRGPVQTFKPMPSSKQSYELVWPRGGGTS